MINMATAKKKATAKPLPPRTKADEICQGVAPDIRPQVVTLANAVLTMQEKIEQQIPIYKQLPLAQQVTVGTGETMLRANPATQEFRATVRDYAQALDSLNKILDENKTSTTASAVDDLRSRFKVG